MLNTSIPHCGFRFARGPHDHFYNTTARTQKPGHGRVGAEWRTVGRRGGASARRDADWSLCLGENIFLILQSFQGTVDNCPEQLFKSTNKRNSYLSNPKPGHTTGGSGRGARRGARAGPSRIECQPNRTVRPGNTSPLYSPKHRRNVASTSPQKHEQAKSYVNRRRNEIGGLSAVYQRDRGRSFPLAADWWTDASLSL